MSSHIKKVLLRLPDGKIERHATWLEIFFDLIFAVLVTQLSSRLMHQLDFQGLLKCSFLFLPLMWTWASYTVFAARFDNNDIIHWIMTFVIMIAGIIMAIQIPYALEQGDVGFSIGFLLGQIAVLFLYIRVESSDLIPHKIVHFYLLGFSLGVLCWIISLFYSAPIKFYLWALGMIIFLIFPWVGRKRLLSKAPLNAIYISERLGAFTVIILGQIIASVVFGLESAHWNFYSAATSVMSFIISIIIFCQYYRYIQVADYKCTLSSGQPYIYTHIPLIMALISMGVCTETFIRDPLISNINIKIIFCGSTVLYLLSFYLLQYLTILKFKVRAITFLSAIIAIILLFLAHPFSPFLTMTAMLVIFVILFGIQLTYF